MKFDMKLVKVVKATVENNMSRNRIVEAVAGTSVIVVRVLKLEVTAVAILSKYSGLQEYIEKNS